jgi:hypothetical protein
MFEDLSAKDPKVKYGAAKALLETARTHPADLYPQSGFFEQLMESENNILKWTAIDVVGYLSVVDVESRLAENTGKLASFLREGKMITANHAVAALARFAKSYPEKREAITTALLDVENCKYDTDECRNIVKGKVIDAFDSYVDEIAPEELVFDFVKRQTLNTRSGTARKAGAFLKKRTGATYLSRPG